MSSCVASAAEDPTSRHETYPNESCPSHNCLVILCGPPASGKTTLATGLCAADDALFQWHHVCFDAVETSIRNKLGTDGFSAEAWSAARAESLQLSGKLLRDAAAGPRTLVVADDNMHLRSMRKEYYNLAVSEGVSFVLVEVCCGLTEALRRNEARGLAISQGDQSTDCAAQSVQVPDSSVQAIHEKMESPDPEKVYWECDTIRVVTSESIDSSDSVTPKTDQNVALSFWDRLTGRWVRVEVSDLPTSADEIRKAYVADLRRTIVNVWMRQPRPDQVEAERAEAAATLAAEREEAQALTSASVLHHVDILLRATVARTMKQHLDNAHDGSAAMKLVAKRANSARKAVLADAKRLISADNCELRNEDFVSKWVEKQFREAFGTS